MSCSGCSGAVDRALGRLDGVENKEVSLEKQTVVVQSENLSLQEVEATIAKTGKKITYSKEI